MYRALADQKGEPSGSIAIAVAKGYPERGIAR